MVENSNHDGSPSRRTDRLETTQKILTIVASVIAILSTLVGLITTQPQILIVAAILAGLALAFWMWHLGHRVRPSRTRRLLFLLSITRVLGSVLVAVLDYARVAGRHPTQSASAKRPPGTSVSTQTTGTIGPSACRFAGVISFQYPGFGNTLSTGHDVYGNVTAWSAGCQVMLFVRPEASSTETRQPRCQVAGTTWTCPNVQLLGAAGTREYLDVLVLDAAASPPDQSAALPHGALAQDDTQAYKA